MHEWIDLAIGVALFVLSCGAGVLGWVVNRFVGDLEKLEEAQEDIRDTQHKYGREIRDTRQAISRIEGRLDMDPFPYTSE